MYIATYETRNFEFLAIGFSEQLATDALKASFDKHKTRYPDAETDEWYRDVDDGEVNVHFVPMDSGINLLSPDGDNDPDANKQVTLPLTLNSIDNNAAVTGKVYQVESGVHNVEDVVSHALQAVVARRAVKAGIISENQLELIMNELEEALISAELIGE